MATVSAQYLPVPNGPSDLWILPPPTSSQWFARVDWYLNWQLSKGLSHPPARPSLDLLRIMEAGEIENVDFPASTQDPLMVISIGRIAASKCVVMKLTEKPEEWFRRLTQIIEQLAARQVHIFLPTGMSLAEAERIWQSLHFTKVETVQFTVDEGAAK